MVDRINSSENHITWIGGGVYVEVSPYRYVCIVSLHFLNDFSS